MLQSAGISWISYDENIVWFFIRRHVVPSPSAHHRHEAKKKETHQHTHRPIVLSFSVCIHTNKLRGLCAWPPFLLERDNNIKAPLQRNKLLVRRFVVASFGLLFSLISISIFKIALHFRSRISSTSLHHHPSWRRSRQLGLWRRNQSILRK